MLLFNLHSKHSLKLNFNCTDGEGCSPWFYILQRPESFIWKAVSIIVNDQNFMKLDELMVDSSENGSLKKRLPTPLLEERSCV